MTGRPARVVAAVLHRRGLVAPARLLVDAHRPIAPLLSDLGAAVGPLIGALGGPGALVGRAISDERALENLLAELDATERADAEPG